MNISISERPCEPQVSTIYLLRGYVMRCPIPHSQAARNQSHQIFVSISHLYWTYTEKFKVLQHRNLVSLVSSYLDVTYLAKE